MIWYMLQITVLFDIVTTNCSFHTVSTKFGCLTTGYVSDTWGIVYVGLTSHSAPIDHFSYSVICNIICTNDRSTLCHSSIEKLNSHRSTNCTLEHQQSMCCFIEKCISVIFSEQTACVSSVCLLRTPMPWTGWFSNTCRSQRHEASSLSTRLTA